MKAGWEVKVLGELAEFRPPKKLAKCELAKSDEVSFVPMDCLQIGTPEIGKHNFRRLEDVYKGYTYFSDGDILLAKITPCFENGKIGIANGLKNSVGFGSSEFFVIRPHKSVIPHYLYYFLNQKSFRNAGRNVMSGAVGHKRVPKEFIEKLSIPFPPLEEQERIVALLDEAFEDLDRAQENVEAKKAGVQELRKSILAKAFAGELDGSDRHPMENLGNAKKPDWDRKPFAKIAEINSGNSISAKDRSGKFSSNRVRGRYFISTKDIGFDGKINHETDVAIPQESSDSFRLARSGTTLVCSEGGSAGRKVGFLEKDSHYGNKLFAIRPLNYVSSRYIYFFCRSWNFVEQFQNRLTGLIGGVSLRKFQTIEIPLPPLDEQVRIVAILDEMFTDIHQLERNIDSDTGDLSDLRQSLLQKAFLGELTN